VHDFFDVLGLTGRAHPLEVRRVSARYIRRWHPDFAPARGADDVPDVHPARDAAVDYVNPASLVDRIQASFFANAS
jgi:hypothetical protein